METLYKDLLLGAAIQIIKDIRDVAYAGGHYEFNEDAIISIKNMTNNFLDKLEPKDVYGESR